MLLPDPTEESRKAVLRRRVWLTLNVSGLSLALAACAVRPDFHVHDDDLAAVATESPKVVASQDLLAQVLRTPSGGGEWLPFVLPGKRYAAFIPALGEGRPALLVRADRSVSILRRRFEPSVGAVGQLSFSWKVDALPEGANLREAHSEDSPVRIVLAFDGDRSKWSPRNHRLSDMSRLLTGEELPYATLAYVWSAQDKPGEVIVNPRTDRIRKVVVEGGLSRVGQWINYQRDVRADFIKAFGEEPGPLRAVALMTDTDNTQSRLQAWYGRLELDVAGTGQVAPP